MSYILAINPGSTSTKVALYRDGSIEYQKSFHHESEDISKFANIFAQRDYRREIILDWLEGLDIKKGDLSAVVGRGGLLRPIPSGCYEVDELMLSDMKEGRRGEHASNLGAIISNDIAKLFETRAFIVDPVSVDEFDPLARISGIPQIERRSMVHALNVRAMSNRYIKEKYGSAPEGERKKLEDINLIVAHLGGGISVIPMKRGKMVDANDANEMGPFSSERSGGLPVGQFAELCFSGKYTKAEIKRMIRGGGGLTGYLGTNDIKAIEERANPEELKYLDALGYQVGKEIGGCAAVLGGDVDAIIVTGGAAYSKTITDKVKKMTSFIAEVLIMPGENELLALAQGAERVVSGGESAKDYAKESSNLVHNSNL